MKDSEKERQMIRAAAEKTAQKTVLPRAAKIDATGEFPWDLVEAFGKQGYLSLLLPESCGGPTETSPHSVLSLRRLPRFVAPPLSSSWPMASVPFLSYWGGILLKKISVSQRSPKRTASWLWR